MLRFLCQEDKNEQTPNEIQAPFFTHALPTPPHAALASAVVPITGKMGV